MRMIMYVHFPVEPFNSLVRDGTVGEKIQQILDDVQPEAVYFSEQDGLRGGILVVDVSDPSRIPALAEPFFLTFDAEVQFRVAMTPEELGRAGLEEIGKRYSQ